MNVPYRYLFHPHLLLCLLLAPCLAAMADQRSAPTPYGLKYFRTPAADPAPVEVLRSAPQAALYRNRVEDAELTAGPYSPALGEVLADEAAYLEKQGDYSGSIRSLRRAVHVTRVNDGLHSVLQLPLVRRLFSDYLAVGDLELADDMQQYLYFLRTDSQPPLSAEKIAAAIELADWRRKTWVLELHDRELKRWHESYRFIDLVLRDIEKLEAPPLEHLDLLTYALLRQLYMLGEGEFGLQEELKLALNRGFADPNSQQLSHEERKMQMLQKGAYTRGKKLLERLSSVQAAAGNTQSQAKAELYLADWHIWHNHHKRAQDNYRNCWQLLAVPELLPLRQQWFAQPLELPVDDVFFVGTQMLPVNTTLVPVTASFSVSKKGKPGDIDTLALPDEHASLGYRLQRWLRDARFRPLLNNMGVPMDSAVLEREYLLTD